jgi:hypothetical protein
MHIRMPFYDNALIEFIMSLPHCLRRKSYLYNKMLLHNFPQYFSRIPWQKTGVAIGTPQPLHAAVSLYNAAAQKANRAMRHFGIRMKSTRKPADYASSIRAKPVCDFFNKLFANKSAIYCEYIERQKVLTAWRRHCNGIDMGYDVAKYATVELWLQQIFNNRYRLENGKIRGVFD